MSLRLLLVSARTEIEEALRDDPGAGAYWMERRPPDLVIAAEAAREFAIAIVDFGTVADGLAMSRALRAANRMLEVIVVAPVEQERAAVDALKSGIFDYVLWPASETAQLWEVLSRAANKVRPPPPRFPIAFGKYTLLELLGVGGMAEVFLAETGTPPRKIVVKRMLESLAAGEEFVAMFMDEARISSLLVHPNIVKVHDFGRVGEQLYIAMEYVPGRNLEQLRIALGGPFPPALACYIVAEVCAALGNAHTKADATGPLGIVHRDVNPPNVLVADDGRVMLTDFGIAKAAHRYYETTSGTLKGKFEYMSPEQANGKRVDRRADVFCAGLVLYELLCGTRPFMAPTPIETLFLIQECNPEPPSKWNARIPKQLDEICMRALAKNPDDRHPEAAELERDLREFARVSMNPGPRDLAVFTKSIPHDVAATGGGTMPPPDVTDGARPDAPVEEPPPLVRGALPVSPKVEDTQPPGRPEDVDALLQRKRAAAAAAKAMPAPPGAGPGLSPRVVGGNAPAVTLAADDAQTAPMQDPDFPRKPAAAPPAPAAPSTTAPASPAARVTPPPGSDVRHPEPSRTTTAPSGDAVPPEASAGMGDMTMPLVIAELEREALSSAAAEAPAATAGNTWIASAPPAVPVPSSDGGGIPAPMAPAPGGDGASGAPAPRTPMHTPSASSELFPPAARAADRARARVQLALGGIGGLVVAVLLVAGGRPGGLLRGSPTPYPATPVAVATPTVHAATPTAPAATPAPARSAVSAAVTPRTTPSSSAASTATPGSTAPVLQPTPKRTSIAVATPSRTLAPVARGTLSIWVEGWATVEIDGRAYGNAPIVGIALPAGKRRVVMTNAAKVRREFDVVIAAGEEKKISVDFRQ